MGYCPTRRNLLYLLITIERDENAGEKLVEIGNKVWYYLFVRVAQCFEQKLQINEAIILITFINGWTRIMALFFWNNTCTFVFLDGGY